MCSQTISRKNSLLLKDMSLCQHWHKHAGKTNRPRTRDGKITNNYIYDIIEYIFANLSFIHLLVVTACVILLWDKESFLGSAKGVIPISGHFSSKGGFAVLFAVSRGHQTLGNGKRAAWLNALMARAEPKRWLWRLPIRSPARHGAYSVMEQNIPLPNR